ncbi:MAG: YhgE/Pip domain-containing protein [Lachnospiraceae bacterium]|nr:YhgE/Pip domain-containing protein [Lachnospiraceae bacterium]
MNNVKRVFKDDIHSVTHNMFALIIAIGICILPALYAWFNIYSNWDPYSNTGNLKLAAVSLDKGYVDEEGVYQNVGSEIMDELKDNDSIGWVLMDSPEEAIGGVESGEYYAAIVINEDFTYNMYNVFTEKVDKPQLNFYENQKRNAVATKISDTVIEKVQTKINTKFVKVLTTEVFKDVNKFSNDFDEKGGVDGIIDKLKSVNNELKSYNKTINAIISANSILKAVNNVAAKDTPEIKNRIDSSAAALEQNRQDLANTQATLKDFTNQVNLVTLTITSSLDNISRSLDEAVLLNDMKAINSSVKTSAEDIKIIRTDLDALSDALNTAIKDGEMSIEQVAEAEAAIVTIKELDKSVDKIDSLIGDLSQKHTGDGIITKTEKEEQNIKKKVDEVRDEISRTQNTVNSQLIPQLDESIDNLETIMSDVNTMVNQVSSSMSSLGNVISSLQTVVEAGDVSLTKTSEALNELSKRLDKVIDKVEKAANNEKVQILLDALKGDPEVYGEFFSEPVKIESNYVYPVETYGSAVAPFFSVLAIWVGGIVLVSVVKPFPNREKYFYMKDTEIFFGRYALYFMIGQIQTFIIVVGDMVIFGVQCLHPILFVIAGALTSLTFTLLIYSLIIAFADVGKAMVVVILVIQIAGSSGTYPIELLPEFFQNVYLFFPFPYAINAIRECIAGMYEADYLIYLLKLMIFIPVALVIGVWIRRPFDSIKRYMQRRMKDTKVM